MPERAALAIDESVLTDATTCLTSSGAIKHAVSTLAKAGPTAGFADWATTYDIGHSYNSIATALHIPRELHIGFYRDSVLYMYNEVGRAKKATNSIYLWSEQNPGYWMSQASCIGGHTPELIIASLPTEPELIAIEDIAMVFCMLLEVNRSDVTAFSESSRVGMDIINLCRKLQELHRPMLVVGGADAIWKYNNPAWDTMVDKILLSGRGMDTPTISGEGNLKRLQLRCKDVHAIKNEHNQGVYLDMFNAIRNAAFAIVPYGTVRK